jgi:hypothetical protein
MRLLCSTPCHDRSQMQLPSTGPLKLAIRWQRDRLKLRMIRQLQIRRFSITDQEDSAADSQHSEVQTCCRGNPPNCTLVRYLCGIQYRMELMPPQVRHCKKSLPSYTRQRNPEAYGDCCQKTVNIFDTSLGISHVHCYNSSLTSPTVTRLCRIP